jgi:hypothetical protein
MICDVVDRYQDFGVEYCLYLQNIRLRAAVVVTGLDTLGWHRMDNFGLGLQPGVTTLGTARMGGT